MVWMRWPTLFLGASLLALAFAGGKAEALDVTVKVTIERIRGLDCMDEIPTPLGDVCDPFFGGADFYAVVTIAGTEFDNKNTPEQDSMEQDDDISPNWEFSKPVDVSLGSIAVKIRIFDEDGLFRGDDDPVDVQAGGDDDLDLTVTLVPCAVSGEISGGCGVTLTSTGDSGNDDAELFFRIEVQEPPSAPGLRVQCIHSPIWPQPGQMMTITVKALDGSLNAKVADTIEIWFNSQAAPVTSGGGTTRAFTTAALAAGEVFYGCRVVDDGVPVFSGWRRLSVGDPPDSRAIPLLFTGPRASRIDIVLVGDEDDYTSATDTQLISDVGSVVLGAYYSEDLFLSNQDKLNFWMADGLGDPERAEDGCDHDPPPGWDDDYAFADVGALLHSTNFRDCARPDLRMFSSEPTSLRTVLHESGHQPFGLADEYCNLRPGSTSSTCDGGYFENNPFPNLYEEPDECADDAPNLGRTAANCQEFIEDGFWFFDTDWSISEPVSNDLMVDNQTPQAADVRRVNWMFGNCAAAGC